MMEVGVSGMVVFSCGFAYFEVLMNFLNREFRISLGVSAIEVIYIVGAELVNGAFDRHFVREGSKRAPFTAHRTSLKP